jgi:teichoic acid transport system ATP-binding protein
LPQFLRGKPRQFYQEFWALHDVSFEISKGETVGIIGRNGSGKSTLLQIIAGTLAPTQGEVEVSGRVAALLELGSGFDLEFSGRENVYMNGAILGLSRTEMEQRFDQIAAFADIGQFIDQPVKLYSSGMFVRLAFAVAINVDPDILIIDEALAVGDIAFQAKCYKKFDEFKNSGKTILFVTHALDSILRYCTKAIVLHEGLKLEEGSPKTAVDVYKRLLVNYYDFSDEEIDLSANSKAFTNDWPNWKEQFNVNPNLLEYGGKEAEIIDYGIFDAQGTPTINILADETTMVKMRIRFNKSMVEPIFAFSIKDIKGVELIGTNTFIEHIDTGTYNPGDEVMVTFSQKMRLQTGPYTLSLGCTNYGSDGLLVFHRLYDVLLFEIVSARAIFGMFDINSKVEVTRI